MVSGGFRIYIDTPDPLAFSQLGAIVNQPGIVVNCKLSPEKASEKQEKTDSADLYLRE